MQSVIVVARVDHHGRAVFGIEKDVGNPLAHTGDVFIDPACIQRLEYLFAPVTEAHHFFLKIRRFLRHSYPPLLFREPRDTAVHLFAILLVLFAVKLAEPLFFRILQQNSQKRPVEERQDQEQHIPSDHQHPCA